LPENYGYDMRNSYRHSGSLIGRHTYDENGKLIPKGIKDPGAATYSQNYIQEKALKFIKNNKDKPFFLYYPTQLPHGPVIAPDISKFMDEPRDKGKFIATDGGSRIPFFANWPNVIQAGTKSYTIVALYDIFPTACEIADVKPPKTDGKSFLSILKGEFPEEKQLHEYLYWENGSHNRDMQSARFRNWFVYRENISVPVKVFDLSKDITCSINLAESRKDIVKEALSIFEEAHTPSKWYSNPEDTEEERSIKIEKAKTNFIKVTMANSRRPKSMKELKKMFDEQKTKRSTYPDNQNDN